MNCVWHQVFFCGVILSSVFNAGYCQMNNTCETLVDCFGSTEYSQVYYKTYYDPSSTDYDPSSTDYDPSDICENSNPVKISCEDKSTDVLQEDPICGQVASEEIIIGPRTKINEFPWMALLQYTEGETIETSCQGASISEEYVVTSATCITRNTNGFKLTSVRLGEWDKTTVVDCNNSSGVWICNNPPVVVPIENTKINIYFDELDDHNHNIGMIQLKQKVEYTDFIKPICLPFFVYFKLNKFYVGKKFEIASWGETSPAGEKSDVLLKVDLEGFACPHDSSHLCIHSTPKRNVCDGDEGAPIMGRTILRNRTYVFLAGVVSNNNSCGPNDGPIFLLQSYQIRYLKKANE